VSAIANPTLKLAVALTVTWLVLVGPASIVGGLVAVEGLSYAVTLCFLPHLLGVAVLLVLGPLMVSGSQGRLHPLVGLLLTMSLRLVVVLLGTILICWHRPDMRGLTFLAWLLPCYVVALAVETRHLIAKVGGSSPLGSQLLLKATHNGTN